MADQRRGRVQQGSMGVCRHGNRARTCALRKGCKKQGCGRHGRRTGIEPTGSLRMCTLERRACVYVCVCVCVCCVCIMCARVHASKGGAGVCGRVRTGDFSQSGFRQAGLQWRCFGRGRSAFENHLAPSSGRADGNGQPWRRAWAREAKASGGQWGARCTEQKTGEEKSDKE